ncbi:hypothetical protein [Mycobacterium sp.]|uniref:hypothetical protein n=1 Tax=Mycobacterium sp. TaxID=1785 RepID=UPI002580BBD4|nr:hypothetical protein [Mycobacterium sp.]
MLSTPETEVTQDEWDLAVFGHNGTLSFTAITQTWLREAAKRWAADDLPKRRVRPGRRTSAAWRYATTSAAWRGCPSRCGCVPTAVNTHKRWAALTWRRSCTG